jgi:hypothetical protein
MTTITLEIEVPRRVDSWADAEEASAAVTRALNRYLVSNSKTGGEIYQQAIQPNAQLVAIMSVASTRLIRDSDIVELKRYFPQERWDRLIPMRALLNAFRAMPAAARVALHATLCGRDYDPKGPEFEER